MEILVVLDVACIMICLFLVWVPDCMGFRRCWGLVVLGLVAVVVCCSRGRFVLSAFGFCLDLWWFWVLLLAFGFVVCLIWLAWLVTLFGRLLFLLIWWLTVAFLVCSGVCCFVACFAVTSGVI